MVVMVLLAVATTVLMGMLAAARPKSADSAAPPGNKHHNQRNPSHARSRLRWHRANHHHRSHHYPTTARQRTHCCTDIREEPEQVTKAAAVAAVQEETLSRPWVAAWRIAHLATAARMAAQALVGEHSVATETPMESQDEEAAPAELAQQEVDSELQKATMVLSAEQAMSEQMVERAWRN